MFSDLPVKVPDKVPAGVWDTRCSSAAVGELYLDDGESVNLRNVHTKLSYQLAPGILTRNKIIKSDSVTEKVVILGRYIVRFGCLKVWTSETICLLDDKL